MAPAGWGNPVGKVGEGNMGPVLVFKGPNGWLGLI